MRAAGGGREGRRGEEGREEGEEGRKEVRQLNCRQPSGLNNTLISIFRIRDESSSGIYIYIALHVILSLRLHQNQS